MNSLSKEIEEIEKYIERLKKHGIYTEWQKKDLEYNQNRLSELKRLNENTKD